MIQSIDLNKMGLSEMNQYEIENIEGGYSAYELGRSVGRWVLFWSFAIAA